MMHGSATREFSRLSKEKWLEYLSNWQIMDVAAIRPDYFCVVAREHIDPEIASRGTDFDLPSRMVFVFADGRCGKIDFTGFAFPKAGSCEHPLRQALMSNQNREGQIYAAGSNQALSEQLLTATKSSDLVSIQRIKRIQGWAYAVSLFRRVFKRVEVGRWEEMSTGLERLPHETRGIDLGFEDIDGLAHDNLYAVGGRGEVFHFDGDRWTRCDFPSNNPLHTVTVAPDGMAHITSLDGSIWAGTHDTWKLVDKAEHGIEYNDSVWFKGQLWLCSDYQLHVWDGKQRRRAEWKGQPVVHSGHMDALEDVLVVAGPGTVHAFDGEDWHVLVWPYSSESAERG